METRYILGLVIGIFILLLLFIIITVVICPVVARKKLEKIKPDILSDTTPLSDDVIQSGKKLINDYSTYQGYINNLELSKTYNCSNSILSNAKTKKIQYVIKYSNIDYSKETLEQIDYIISYIELLNDFNKKINNLREKIIKKLPFFIKGFTNKDKLPYTLCGLDKSSLTISEPIFTFHYKSPAEKVTRTLDIKLDLQILNAIKAEINKKVEKTGHSKAQRSAMSNDLREAVKKRDNYTCCICGNSIYKEPNLLLEVDHIVPISKGGKTELNNLQTLCWRCNREKSNN